MERSLARAAHRDHRLDVLQRAALDADVAADDPHHLLVQLAAARTAAPTGSAALPGGTRASPTCMLLGTGPPTSLQCAFTDTKPVSRPSQNTGAVMATSLRWLPLPVYGSLWMKMSPSRNASIPRSRDGRLDREPEVALEHRQADALRDHLHVGIEDRAAEVEALADDVVVGGLDHGDRACARRRR